MKAFIALLPLLIATSSAFSSPSFVRRYFPRKPVSSTKRYSSNEDESWRGEVASNTPDGAIRGCSLQRVDGSLILWTITIDGMEADLGKFSEAIYKKITMDAKKERFQGFRPGTIPPHLLPTYKAFTMDEVAREATLEAMQQNNIRPFEDARSEMQFEKFSILQVKKAKKKKGKKNKKVQQVEVVKEEEEAEENQSVWLTFDTMKEAINAGWQPGQSFSFVAKNVKGQKVKGGSGLTGTPLGQSGSAIDLNRVAANVAANAARNNNI